jgi:hypothetical protein
MDIGIVKYIEKPNKTYNMDKNSLIMILFNESGIYFTNLNYYKESTKDFEIFLLNSKLLNCLEKTVIDLDLITNNSKHPPIIKKNEFNLTLESYNLRDKIDLLNNQNVKNFNCN